MKNIFLAALALVLLAIPGRGFDTRDTPTAADGVRAVVDLPASQHMRNTGGNDLAPDRWGRPTNPGRVPGQGSGLCVFTSIEHASRWQNVAAIAGLQKWMTNQEGGGYPSKVDAMLKKFCASKNLPVPAYIQHEGGEADFLELALHTDRMPCITYDGRDGFYSGAVGHMVNLAYLDSTHAAIIDNNRPGKWVWMTRAEFLSRWLGSGGGWAIVFLDSPPPPYPTEPKNELAAVAPCNCQGPPCKCEKCNCANWAEVMPKGYVDPFEGLPRSMSVITSEGRYLAVQEEYLRIPDRVGPLPQPPTFVPIGSSEYAEPFQRIFGQLPNCPNGQCPLPSRLAPPVSVPVQTFPDGWNTAEADEHGPRWTYWQGGKLIGQLDSTGWHPALGGGIAVKAEALPANLTHPETHLTGVVPNHVGKARKYQLKDKEVEKHVAFAALTAGGMLDDSNHWHLTAVGTEAFIAKVKADIAALPPDLQAQILFQGYGANDWPVSQFQLPSGLSLRKPSPVRVGGDIASLVADSYEPAKLIWLLQQPGGPLPPPPPPPPPPTPMPPPDPILVPSPPVIVPTPAAVGSQWQTWLFAGACLVAFWFIRRSAAMPAKAN